MDDLDYYLNALDSYSSGSSSSLFLSQGAQTWTTIASIIAIVAGILVFFLFVRSKNEPKNKFLKWLKSFLSFKTMWIEALLKITYYIATIYIMLYSFVFLTMGLGGYGVLMWLLTLILGPVLIRVVYEMLLMLVMIWRNTQSIADNTKKGK